jgi:hypothetical protein
MPSGTKMRSRKNVVLRAGSADRTSLGPAAGDTPNPAPSRGSPWPSTSTAPPTPSCPAKLQQRDGSTVTVGTFALADGYGYWAGPARLDRDTLTSACILDTHGQVVASATFTH